MGVARPIRQRHCGLRRCVHDAVLSAPVSSFVLHVSRHVHPLITVNPMLLMQGHQCCVHWHPSVLAPNRKSIRSSSSSSSSSSERRCLRAGVAVLASAGVPACAALAAVPHRSTAQVLSHSKVQPCSSTTIPLHQHHAYSAVHCTPWQATGPRVWRPLMPPLVRSSASCSW